jgi:hypothetical protein
VTLENRRDPAEGRVIPERLQTHEDGDRPGERIPPESADPGPGGVQRRPVLRRRPPARGVGQPQPQPDQRKQRPQPDRLPPADAEQMLEGDRQPGRHSAADEQRHRVEGGHHDADLGKVGLDHARQDDVADRDRRADDRSAPKQRHRRGEQAQQTAGGEGGEDERQRRSAPEPADEARTSEGEDTEAEHRDRGEQAAGGRTETGGVADLPEDRRDRGDRQAQIDRDEYERRRGRPLRACHRAGLSQRSGRPG